MTNQFSEAETPTAVIYQLAGAASMCWENISAAGEFQSDKASASCAEAIAKLQEFGINITDYGNQPEPDEPDFMQELTRLLNRFSCENVSDTPDYVLASYIAQNLQVFNEIVRQRDSWHGFEPWPDRNKLMAAPE